MQAILYYLSYPFIYIISLLPFSVLEKISNFLFYILAFVIQYRKKIISKNISRSFPEKSKAEVRKIRNEFYHFFCDLLLLSIKSIRVSESEIRKRNKFSNPEIIDQYKGTNKNILLILGHYGGWEITGSAFSLQFDLDLIAAYKPLSNPYFDSLMRKSRSRFYNVLIPKRHLIKYLETHKKSGWPLVLIADQSPSPRDHYWVNFLNQETAVVKGMEKIARQYDCAVVYVTIAAAGRFKNEIRMQQITEDASKEEEKFVTEAFMKKLEQDIVQNPAPYLWSHRRWKLTDRFKKINRII